MVLATSDVLEHKNLVPRRTRAWAEAMRIDGAVVSLDSWGNRHIDLTSGIEALGERRIPLVGMSFVGNQAAFVVTNSCMGTILDLNKTTAGIENMVAGQNTVVDLDTLKVVTLLKRKICKKFSERDFSVSRERNIRRILHRSFPVQRVCLVDQSGLEETTLTVGTSAVVLPPEPCACRGGTSIMDLGNMPLLLSPNEIRDGMLHSLT